MHGRGLCAPSAMLREVWVALKETAVQTYWLSRKNLLLLVRRLIRSRVYRSLAGRASHAVRVACARL